MLKLMMFLSLFLLEIPATSETDDFVPKDIIHAQAIGCLVAGVHDSPSYAEVQVFVKYNGSEKAWDFRPIVARYTVDQGGVIKAIDDCRDWLAAVQKKIRATKAEGEASKQP